MNGYYISWIFFKNWFEIVLHHMAWNFTLRNTGYSQMGKPPLTVLCAMTMNRTVKYTQTIYFTAALSSDRMIVSYTNDKPSLPLTFEMVGYWCADLLPMFCGRSRLDANVFRRFQQRLLESWSVTIPAPVNAGRPQMVRTPDNGVVIIATVEWRSWSI
jgi:hypothetical protein